MFVMARSSAHDEPPQQSDQRPGNPPLSALSRNGGGKVSPLKISECDDKRESLLSVLSVRKVRKSLEQIRFFTEHKNVLAQEIQDENDHLKVQLRRLISLQGVKNSYLHNIQITVTQEQN